MKKTTINLIGILAAFTLVLGIYIPTEKTQSPIMTLVEHGDGGG
ncbi:hypothetical protein [Bacillus clarus]|nr:hypothetical protein [Bacillus clarus]